MRKTLYQQAPKFIVFAKVNWAVHGLHAVLLQPLFSGIKQFKGCILVVYTFKKANTACWLFGFVSFFIINKGGNTAYKVMIIVAQYPAGNFSVPVKIVF